MKSDLLTKRITRTAIIAAIYAATTLAIAPFAYGSIQFRISEILVLLALFDPLYISGLTLGCLIANMLGPNGLLDIIFGTLATFISLIAIYFTGKIIKNYILSLYLHSCRINFIIILIYQLRNRNNFKSLLFNIFKQHIQTICSILSSIVSQNYITRR